MAWYFMLQLPLPSLPFYCMPMLNSLRNPWDFLYTTQWHFNFSKECVKIKAHEATNHIPTIYNVIVAICSTFCCLFLWWQSSNRFAVMNCHNFHSLAALHASFAFALQKIGQFCLQRTCNYAEKKKHYVKWKWSKLQLRYTMEMRWTLYFTLNH